MPRRVSDWRRQSDRALQALEAGKWWDGKRWHSPDEGPAPKRSNESAADYRARVHAWVRQRAALMQSYEAPSDVLAEALKAMMGDGPPDSDAKLQALQRLIRSAEADRDERSASTEREAEAEQIFEAAKPFLRKRPLRNGLGFTDEPASRTAWTALAAYITRLRPEAPPLDANRLRMICRNRGEK